jgi:sRNA-binding protein
VNGMGYLANAKEGAARIGLDGAPAGVVTAAEAKHARLRLRARFKRRGQEAKAKAAAVPAPAPTRRSRAGLRGEISHLFAPLPSSPASNRASGLPTKTSAISAL